MRSYNQLNVFLKSFPLLVKAKRNIWSHFDETRGSTTLNILRTFPIFLPYSAGKYAERASLTVQSINQLFPFLHSLSKFVSGNDLAIEDISRFPKTGAEISSASKLKELFDHYGSDKANRHNFHHLYGAILCDKDNVKNIFEIGLGTNNTDVVSNMGRSGKPGASHRAFRDYCRNATVYGGDIDERILFQDERIETFHMDQTDPSTFERIIPALTKEFDLVIDDGLHSPDANVATLQFGLKIIRRGGWVVVEDIGFDSICVWQVVAALLPATTYRSHIFRADEAIVFAVQRLS